MAKRKRRIGAERVIICKECGEEKIHCAKGLCKRCYKSLDKHYRDLKDLYGMTLIDYDNLLEIQDNGCWICGMSPEENGQRLSVDHCHESGEIRGLLCLHCNLLLGNANDNIQVLARAIEYLSRSVKCQV